MRNFPEIDAKWQNIWHEGKYFYSEINSNKKKYYVLEMFPYPSGKIHVGHLRNYSIGDVIARFYRANNYNVLYPMGWDAFGLPAENAAIQNKIHPLDWTLSNIQNMREQIKSVGISYDWRKELTTCLPEYYKHEQSFFIKLLKKNLAYQKESVVNWDPVDNTVLANEQVIDGRGWRSGALVEKKNLKQWFLKITNYAEELLDGIKQLDGWPESVKTMQENWIGKSFGANVHFKIKNSDQEIIIYTTCPDTLYGASFIAICYDHNIISQIEKTDEINDFISKCRHMSTSAVDIEKAEKYGVKTNLVVKHPFDPSIELPVYIANFVLREYGTGAIFGCPAHDQRDHEFATKYHLPIKQVVEPKNEKIDVVKEPYTKRAGKIINSEFLDGLEVEEAKLASIKKLEEIKFGKACTNFKLKDWGVSRQRYWGCPIPIIYCNDCGTVPVKEQDLPVELPYDIDFTGSGNPLDKHPTWKNTNCPLCSKPSTRETDTFDTFFESSWYFARFCNNNYKTMVDKNAADYWLPVDQYIGGIEHAILHLLYARFFTKAMNDEGILGTSSLKHKTELYENNIDFAKKDSNIREPFKNLLTQGMVLHATFKDSEGNFIYPSDVVKAGKGLAHKDSGLKVTEGKIEKMSKSKKNIIDLDSIIKRTGADTVRMFVLSDSPPEKELDWSESGIDGCSKFLTKLFVTAEKIKFGKFTVDQDKKLLSFTHITIKMVTNDIRNFHFNKAIARIRELYNMLSEELFKKSTSSTLTFAFNTIIKLFNPFAPHITEEIWSYLGNKKLLVENSWPSYDESLAKSKEVTIAVQVNGKLRGTVTLEAGSSKEEVENLAKKNSEINKYLDGVLIKKLIVIPDKIINFVI